MHLKRNRAVYKGTGIANFYTFYSIHAPNLPIWTKMVILTTKMVEIFGIIFNLTAVKNYASNFADSPFGPDYGSYSNASLTAPSISTNI